MQEERDTSNRQPFTQYFNKRNERVRGVHFGERRNWINKEKENQHTFPERIIQARHPRRNLKVHALPNRSQILTARLVVHDGGFLPTVTFVQPKALRSPERPRKRYPFRYYCGGGVLEFLSGEMRRRRCSTVRSHGCYYFSPALAFGCWGR